MIGRILLLGANGQLGWEAQRALSCLGEVVSYDYPQVDFTNLKSLASLVNQIAPRIIFNAAAYTAVDRAENEPDLAYTINAAAPAVLAEYARTYRALLVHFSTDYIFDGQQSANSQTFSQASKPNIEEKNAPPQLEDVNEGLRTHTGYIESDYPSPLNVYGQTKLAGEQAIQQIGGLFFIFRTSWVYSLNRGGFVSKVLEWARQKPVLRIVSDQISSPTAARFLAEISAGVLFQSRGDLDWMAERAGVYHLAGDGAASRFDWARAILENDPRRFEQTVRQVEPALTSEFPSPARRPLFSALNCERFISTFGLRLPAWQTALRLILQT
ncbi:MAG: sugar nucleotide-binding protein [Anaerolineaceae bacterium]|nr:sugar nucleotide-binding protein [Anaerolineaceae bacterium]